MNDVTETYLSRAETWLLLTTLVYFLMNGAQLFETLVIVPKWTVSPPESFGLFRGKYGLDFKVFWIAMHSVHEITFLLAILFCWKLEIRNWLLVLFAVHVAVRVWTLAYFAPNIIAFQQLANAAGSGTSTLPATDLFKRASLWKNLNYVRVGIFIAVSLGLLPLCVRLLHLKAG
jgi:hypothetical protein